MILGLIVGFFVGYLVFDNPASRTRQPPRTLKPHPSTKAEFAQTYDWRSRNG